MLVEESFTLGYKVFWLNYFECPTGLNILMAVFGFFCILLFAPCGSSPGFETLVAFQTLLGTCDSPSQNAKTVSHQVETISNN